MASLLRQGASRRNGGSVLQRTQAAVTSPAVAEERRQLPVPRRMYSSQEGAGEDISSKIQRNCAKWRERRLRFERLDAEFTKFLKGAFGIYSVYAIISAGNYLDELEAAAAAAAQTDKK